MNFPEPEGSFRNASRLERRGGAVSGAAVRVVGMVRWCGRCGGAVVRGANRRNLNGRLQPLVSLRTVLLRSGRDLCYRFLRSLQLISTVKIPSQTITKPRCKLYPRASRGPKAGFGCKFARRICSFYFLTVCRVYAVKVLRWRKESQLRITPWEPVL